ncbi:unnamed protein product [Wickerhamomyces anomalus]
MSAATQEQGKNALDAEKQKVIQSLEEDDEFEDFQAEEEQSLGPEGEKSLWVEDWDDNDADDNFTNELKYVLK